MKYFKRNIKRHTLNSNIDTTNKKIAKFKDYLLQGKFSISEQRIIDKLDAKLEKQSNYNKLNKLSIHATKYKNWELTNFAYGFSVSVVQKSKPTIKKAMEYISLFSNNYITLVQKHNILIIENATENEWCIEYK